MDEVQHQTFFLNAPVPMLVVNTHMTIMDANFSAEQLFTTQRKSLLGKNLSSIIPEALPVTNATHLDGVQFQATYEKARREISLSAFGSEMILALLPKKEGATNKSHSQKHSDNRNANDLPQSPNPFADSNFEQIAKSINISIFWIDLVGIIQYANPAAEKLLGYTAKETQGYLNILSLHDQEEIREYLDEIEGNFQKNSSTNLDALLNTPRMGVKFEREWTYIRKDHSRVPVLVSISASKDASGKISGYIVLAVDISRRKRSEKSLALALESATEASKTKSSFLANMSHEIRTPMNSIIGMTELLLDTDLTPEQRQYVEIFRRAGNTLLYLINDILDFSKIEAGRMTVEMISTDVRKLVAEISETFKIKAVEKSLDFTVKVAPQTPQILYTDPVRLKQA